MRTLLGPAATAIGSRGIALERAAMVTLRRDAYAEVPGPTLGLAIGERTTYRPGAWVLDTFERAALGSTYAAWGGAAGLTLGAGGVTVAVGPVGMVTHPLALPRDAWAAVQIGALSGDAEVGLLLRAADTTADGYWITATPTLTVVERLDVGVATSLASVTTPWRAGEMLRAVWAWDALRVYRDTILVAQVTDGSRRLAGRAGFTARRGDAGAQAAITAFLGGEARQEWLGAGLDLGDLQRVLGQPMSFDLTLSNVAPMGGADRFAALLRHGVNTVDTYDLDRGAVRVLTVIDGLSPPLTAGLGVIDGVAELTEDRVRLACRGRDAFLTPQLAAGRVTYLPGPPPGGLTPLPADPCAPSTPPDILPGAVPAEPGGAGEPAEGLGPDAPPAPPALPLLGTWQIRMDYHLVLGGGATGADIYVGSTTCAQVAAPGSADVTAAGATPSDHFRFAIALSRAWTDLASEEETLGSAAYPAFFQRHFMYRGPDVGGTHLVRAQVPWYGFVVPENLAVSGGTYSVGQAIHGTGGPPEGLAPGESLTYGVTLARYEAQTIHTPEDLTALRPMNPGELAPPGQVMDATAQEFPGHQRIETLASWTLTTDAYDLYAPGEWRHHEHPDGSIPTNQFIGPQLLALELGDGWGGASHHSANAMIQTMLTWNATTVGTGSGAPGNTSDHLGQPGGHVISWGSLGAALG